jgi:hypothetical protein
MADDPAKVPEPSPAASVVAPASAPVLPGASTQSAAATAPQPSPLESPAVAAPSILPANELAKPADKPAEPGVHDTPTLLETVGDQPKPAEPVKAEAKPADAKPAEPAKPGDKPAEPVAEAKPAEPPAPIEYKYTVPETLTLDDTSKGELHKALDEFRADPSVGVQKIVDVGAKLMTDYATNLKTATEKHQREVFAETNKNWHAAILADPELGGSGYQTTSAAVARMRDKLVPAAMLAPRQNPDGTPRMSEFQEFCRVTGAGNHPVFWHMLHNAARYLDEPQARNIPTEIKPPADIGRNPNKRRGAQILYDNPRSSPDGRG